VVVNEYSAWNGKGRFDMSYLLAACVMFAGCFLACFVAFWIGRGKLLLEYRMYVRRREAELDQLESSYSIED
jgi:membrane protein DedA with SNARE-associated domain